MTDAYRGSPPCTIFPTSREHPEIKCSYVQEKHVFSRERGELKNHIVYVEKVLLAVSDAGISKALRSEACSFYLADFIGDTPIKHYDLGTNFEVAI